MNATEVNGHPDPDAIANFLGDATKIELYEAAVELHARGLPILLTDNKAPMGGDGWQRREFNPNAAPHLLRQAKAPGIGLKFGPSSGIIDIEADGPEEEQLVAKLFEGCEFPITPAYRSTRGVHRLFKFDDRLQATGQAIVSYRNGGKAKLGCRIGAGDKGAQSVIPPSPGREWLPRLSMEDVDPAPLPDGVVQRIITAAGEKKPEKTTPAPHATAAVVNPAILAAIEKCTAKMQDGGDGSKRLFACCCRGVELNGSDAEIIATIRAHAQAKPFPKDWSDAEIVQRIRDAEKEVERGSEVEISNYEEIEVEDGDETRSEKVPLSMEQIIDDIRRQTGNWPRRIDTVLFVDDPLHGLDWFDRRTTAGLFGWLRRKFKVRWAKGGNYVAQSELFAEIERTAKRYDAIELFPHEPPIGGIYYRGNTPKPGDGLHFRWLLDRFRPETTIDRDLIQAAFMTPVCGIPAGCRPAFVITSDYGRGVGKTKLAELIAYLYGGFIDVSAGEDIATLKQRLLSPEGQTKRVAILDNVKTMRLSWAELESLITNPTISGKRMYVGEGRRPNLITWLITLNGVSLATDMSQRSIIIKLAKGKNDGPWYEDTLRYVDQHRDAIIGDIISALRVDPYPLAQYSRWATWEQAVLSRLPEPGEAQRVILERQGEANCEQDEAELLEDYFADRLAWLGYEPHTAQVRIPAQQAAYWFGKAMGEPTKTAAASRRLHQMASEGQLQRLAPEPGRSHGRCFIWTGAGADPFTARIANDLPTRLTQALQSHAG